MHPQKEGKDWHRAFALEGKLSAAPLSRSSLPPPTKLLSPGSHSSTVHNTTLTLDQPSLFHANEYAVSPNPLDSSPTHTCFSRSGQDL